MKLVVLAALVAACGTKASDRPAAGSAGGSATGSAGTSTHAERQRFIDFANARPNPGLRLSFGSDDTTLVIALERGACTEDLVNKFVEINPVRQLGFARAQCTDRQPDVGTVDAAFGPVPGAAVEVTATELVKDYKADEISADDKYRNRTIIVSGRLTKLGIDPADQPDPPFMRFQTSAGDVSARFPDNAIPKTLKVGQDVRFRCVGKGYQMVTALLEECTVL